MQQFIEWLVSPDAWRYASLGLLAAAIEFVYGAALARSPVTEVRSRGYHHMWEAAGGLAAAGFFILCVVAVAQAVSLTGFPSPEDAKFMLDQARDRFVKWLIQVANLEKDLTAAVITAPLTQTIAASSILGRFALQSLLALVSAFSFALPLLVDGGVGQLMVAAGIACLSTPRLRRLGPYLIFSAIAMLIASCGVARAAYDLAQQLKFRYEGFGSLPNPLEFLRTIFDLLRNELIPTLVNDGYASAQTLVWVSIGIALAAAVTAAASAAAGGFADSLVNRIRL
ncbi:MAG: hypothetical protein LM580_00270 [Thermofilum sp.]|nr:hypothetical protein [Thermofilum sp.]